MTKKQNKRLNVRKARRLLNLYTNFAPKITGKLLNSAGYGAGLTKGMVKENEAQ
jgi:hypothetical protein